jgi:uncharacterized protein with NRDE domain
MCLVALAWQMSKRFPLVMVGNRDEFLHRPTAPLAAWRSDQGMLIYGGRDLQEGGTWMGLTPKGRFAVLTNVRQAPALKLPPSQLQSRGNLVVDWLHSQEDAPAWAQRLPVERFNGFNLLLGQWHPHQKHCHFLHHSPAFKPNQGLAPEEYIPSATNIIANELQAEQVYGLSNASLDTPWPKTVALKNTLQHAMAEAEQLPSQQEALAHVSDIVFAQLANPATAPDDLLPDTGVPLTLERALSSAFVSYPASPEPPRYGTRSSWLLALQASGRLHLQEITHARPSLAAQQRIETLHWHS